MTSRVPETHTHTQTLALPSFRVTSTWLFPHPREHFLFLSRGFFLIQVSQLPSEISSKRRKRNAGKCVSAKFNVKRSQCSIVGIRDAGFGHIWHFDHTGCHHSSSNRKVTIKNCTKSDFMIWMHCKGHKRCADQHEDALRRQTLMTIGSSRVYWMPYLDRHACCSSVHQTAFYLLRKHLRWRAAVLLKSSSW